MSKKNGGRKRRKWSNMKRPNRITWPCRLCGAIVQTWGLCGACERAQLEAKRTDKALTAK